MGEPPKTTNKTDLRHVPAVRAPGLRARAQARRADDAVRRDVDEPERRAEAAPREARPDAGGDRRPSSGPGSGSRSPGTPVAPSSATTRSATAAGSGLLDEWIELRGDRLFGDDKAISTGFARMGPYRFLLIGHRKGRETKEKLACNFGCAHPEGYRKALQKMKLAERFGLPIVTLINTPGAYPGIGAEERGQAWAIAENILEMSALRVPTLCIVIGEGGSGGALGHRRRRPRADARARLLLGDLARGLRRHPLEERREGGRGRQGAAPDERGPAAPEDRRRGREGAARRRPPRPRGDGRDPEGDDPPSPEGADRDGPRGAAGRALRQAAQLRQRPAPPRSSPGARPARDGPRQGASPAGLGRR